MYLETQLRVDEKNSAGDITAPLKPPSYATVSRRINELDAEALYRAKYGKRAADAEFAQFEKTPLPSRPLVRVEIDHTRLDLILIDTADELPLGRPTLTTVIDTATRYPLGYYLGFEPASYLSVMEALSHAFRPKQNVREQYGTAHEWLAYGLPRTLVVDGGKEFRGRDLKDACLQLGIHLELAPKYAPEFKAVVERFFGTNNTGLIHTLDGTTFSNIFQRGDYESLKAAKLSLHDVDKIMHIFLLDYYAEAFHEGLQGIPARRWETFVQDGFTPRLPANIDELEILLGRTEERTIFNYGINLFGIRYNATALALVRTQLKEGEKVKVKYHPADISRIYVYDPFGNRYVEVPATEPEYVQGLSLWKHRVIRNFLLREQDSVDEAGLAWAKRKIRQIVAEAKARSKGSTTRKRIARYETNGRSAQNLPVHPAENLSVSQALVADEATESSQPTAPFPMPQQLQKLSNLQLTFDPKELEAEGWGVIHHRD